MFLDEASLQDVGSSGGCCFPSPIYLEHLRWVFSIGKPLREALTLDNLKRRGKASANRCFLYGEEE